MKKNHISRRHIVDFFRICDIFHKRFSMQDLRMDYGSIDIPLYLLPYYAKILSGK